MSYYTTEDLQKKNRVRGIVCCVVYGVALLVATHISLGEEVKENQVYLVQKEFYIDKVIQFLAYTLFSVLVGLAFVPMSKDASETVKDLDGQKLTVIGAAIIGFAVLDESTQPFFGRTFEFSDFIANVFGIAFGLVAFVALNEVRHHMD